MKLIEPCFNNNFSLSSISLDKTTINLSKFSLLLDTDYGLINCYEFVSNVQNDTCEALLPFGKITITLNKLSSINFLEYKYTLTTTKEVSINKVILNLKLNELIDDSFIYNTFKNASTFVLARVLDHSLIFGVTNPIFTYNIVDDLMIVKTKTALKLSSNSTFDLDNVFIGLVKQDKHYVLEQTPVTAYRVNDTYHTRYRNPSGSIPLQRSEIRSFKRYSDYYLSPYCHDLHVVYYTYFSPFPRLITSDSDEEIYYEYIRNFKKLGGDMIIFNPIERFVQPVTTNDSSWIISKEGSRAKRVLEFCQENNISYGFTWGSAVLNTNSPMTSYSLIGEKNYWKKIGKGGELSRENCICCSDFYEWFKNVQLNTIKREKILLWDWDPGPGIASFCYSSSHGHYPGYGLYYGYKKAMQMIKDMKQKCPNLLIQSFHGLKEYGLWGMKGIDWHESYWEQDPYFFAASNPDFSADRYTADGMRMQCWWNHNFRFLPSMQNQFMSSRMIQNCFYPSEYRYLFDFYGYKYALLSAIACGGSITFPMLPFSFDFCPDYFNFVSKWINYAKKNYYLNKNMTSFGSQVRVGGIDGYAKWSSEYNNGLIFLFNPSPYKISYSLDFNEEIGLDEDNKHAYNISILYPFEAQFFDTTNNKSIFKFGDTACLSIDEYSCLVLEVTCKLEDYCLYNIPGTISIIDNTCNITSSLNEGTITNIVVKSAEFKKLLVNDVELPFTTHSDYSSCSICFGEELIRSVSRFNDIDVPFNICDKTIYQSSVFVSSRIKKLLEKKHAMLPKEMINSLKKINNPDFIWSMPDRLFATLTFNEINEGDKITLCINNIEVPVRQMIYPAHNISSNLSIGYYADITDIVKYGEVNSIKVSSLSLSSNNIFYGIQFYYPEGEQTSYVNEHLESVGLDESKYQPKEIIKGERKPTILAGWIMENVVEEYKEFTLVVDVNLSFNELEGVYCSNPINIDDSLMTLMTDNYLTYDPKNNVWKKKFYMGSRQFLIVDEEYLYVWAVTKNKETSETYKVRLEWRLF